MLVVLLALPDFGGSKLFFELGEGIVEKTYLIRNMFFIAELRFLFILICLRTIS